MNLNLYNRLIESISTSVKSSLNEMSDELLLRAIDKSLELGGALNRRRAREFLRYKDDPNRKKLQNTQILNSGRFIIVAQRNFNDTKCYILKSNNDLVTYILYYVVLCDNEDTYVIRILREKNAKYTYLSFSNTRIIYNYLGKPSSNVPGKNNGIIDTFLLVASMQKDSNEIKEFIDENTGANIDIKLKKSFDINSVPEKVQWLISDKYDYEYEDNVLTIMPKEHSFLSIVFDKSIEDLGNIIILFKGIETLNIKGTSKHELKYWPTLDNVVNFILNFNLEGMKLNLSLFDCKKGFEDVIYCTNASQLNFINCYRVDSIDLKILRNNMTNRNLIINVNSNPRLTSKVNSLIEKKL